MNWELFVGLVALAAGLAGYGYPLYVRWLNRDSERDSWYTFAGVDFRGFGDRILVVEDPFRSGYECKVCDGSGGVECISCMGTGNSRVVAGARCSTCQGSGKDVCPACKGKGATIVVPEIAQRRPTTGEIVSVGRRVKDLKVGQSVMYGSFTGHVSELEAQDGTKIILRTLHEAEILSEVQGHLEYRADKGNQPAKQAMGV